MIFMNFVNYIEIFFEMCDIIECFINISIFNYFKSDSIWQVL